MSRRGIGSESVETYYTAVGVQTLHYWHVDPECNRLPEMKADVREREREFVERQELRPCRECVSGVHIDVFERPDGASDGGEEDEREWPVPLSEIEDKYCGAGRSSSVVRWHSTPDCPYLQNGARTRSESFVQFHELKACDRCVQTDATAGPDETGE